MLVARETKPASADTESIRSEVLTRGGCTCVYLDGVFEILGFFEAFSLFRNDWKSGPKR